MKKILFISSFLISSLAMADIDLSRSYDGDTLFGYSGISGSTKYIQYSSNKEKEDINFLNYKYLYIDSLNKDLINSLENDNKENEKIFNVDYSKFKFNKYDSNIYSVLLGISNNSNSRVGLKLNYEDGELKKSKNKDISGQFFYSYKNKNKEYNFIGFLGKNDIKEIENKEKNLYYGFYGKYKQGIKDEYLGYFSYLEPSLFFDTTIQRYDTKVQENKENKKIINSSINSTIGIEGKKEFIIDSSIKISPIVSVGYNREFLEKKKFKSYEIKEENKDNIFGEVGINLSYNDFINIESQYQIKKSINTSDYTDRVMIGIKFKL